MREIKNQVAAIAATMPATRVSAPPAPSEATAMRSVHQSGEIDFPDVVNISRPKNALKVAMVTMIEMIRKPAIRGCVNAAERYSEGSREQETDNPIASADCVQRQRGEMLTDGGVVVQQRRQISGSEKSGQAKPRYNIKAARTPSRRTSPSWVRK